MELPNVELVPYWEEKKETLCDAGLLNRCYVEMKKEEICNSTICRS